ncbi:desulfoferrodoxin FeS4 iron-binding domain-containing protein, partial [Candidatus Bathyarchaeota archaeon]|nr:desulfoferrodoxin FeS4 iron-binding domain-containing protein [Candidatus Bathyarchaeota archaeon]
MTKRSQIYKCNICGNIVEVLNPGAGTLVCYGKPMELLIEKTKDVGSEKHVPIIEKTEKGVRVKVGSIPHPMEETHHIQWIEVLADGLV